jgi:ATP-binding cassette subfamily F protein 3
MAPSAGSVRVGENLTVGYLDQHGDTLDPDRSVLDEAHSADPELVPEQVRNRLGAFLFTGDDVYKQCADLSGGQRNRLMLCKLVLGKPDVLVMDEPTNHLDIASREMLEAALDDFTGTIITVSHDRYFLDRVVEKLLVVGTDELGNRCLGRTEFVAGEPAYTVYGSTVRQRVQAEQQQQQTAAAGSGKRRAAESKPEPQAKTPEELKRFNKYSPEQLEAMILRLEHELDETKERFGDETVYKDPDRLAELQEHFAAQQAEIDLLYRAYDRRTG